MGVFLKDRDKSVFLKSYDGVTGDIEFTTEEDEAKSYQNDWFARAELDYLLFHFPDYKEEYLGRMIVYYT